VVASGSVGRKVGAESVVVTSLIGGLGNQLFQYAAGRRLAQFRGVDLKLDITGFSNPSYRTKRHYELAAFNVVQTFATEVDIIKLTRPCTGLLPHLFHRIARKSVRLPKSYIKEPHYHFDPRILNLPDDVYLDGYWQSEQYFADIAELIRKEVTVKVPLVGRNADVAREIADCKAVSLHVRRGDYVNDEVTHEVHGTCGLDYYARAVDFIASRINNPVFFVFSDDPAWVREQLKMPHSMKIVDHNGPEHGYEDMRLMSLCNHHIIANSSFSWWGAWLNSRQDKIVLAPKRWLNNSDVDTRDICPDSWVRL
jgi:Glycosyl transferase family 11